jgi:hypothetical protein
MGTSIEHFLLRIAVILVDLPRAKLTEKNCILRLCVLPSDIKECLLNTCFTFFFLTELYWVRWEWWHTPIIIAFRRLRHEDCEFEPSLGYIVTPCLKKEKKVSSYFCVPGTL